MKAKALSATMKDAIEYARLMGGNLYRHPGGYWSHKDFRSATAHIWFSDGTIKAIVARGLATFTAWRARSAAPDEQFPIEITLTEGQQTT